MCLTGQFIQKMLLFGPLKMGRNFVFRCVLACFHLISGTSNNGKKIE